MTIDWNYYNEPCHSDGDRVVGSAGQQLPPPTLCSGPLLALQHARDVVRQPGVEHWREYQARIDEEAFLEAFKNRGPAPDMVRQPSHYARYTIEPVTFIGANQLPFDVGNVIKYVCRYDAKNGLEDLEKAKRYVEIVIERVKREQRVANGERAQTVWSEII